VTVFERHSHFSRKSTKLSRIHWREMESNARRSFAFPPVASDEEIDILSQSDPTDHALAAIASILDHSDSHHELEKTTLADKTVAHGLAEADGYHKFGPGPLAAIRFKWTVRRDASGDYYVNETIGENSAPIVEGPMSNDAAIKFVDDREREARRRFELLKSEMTRLNSGNLAGKDGGET
jgi:hypothetical protein